MIRLNIGMYLITLSMSNVFLYIVSLYFNILIKGVLVIRNETFSPRDNEMYIFKVISH